MRTPSVYLLIAPAFWMEEPREEGQRVRKESGESERGPKGARKGVQRKVKDAPVQRVFCMAYAATVTLHDATGKALHPA